MRAKIPAFSGELIQPGDVDYETHREVWNAMVDRRPALIARCTIAADVAAAVRFGRTQELELAVKCGGHSVLGHSVPDGGLMIDLTPMSQVSVDPDGRRAVVGGGALLRYLDRAAQAHGLATTAGNVSHTGVGGLTLGGGMGWLARQAGLACDNVEAFTVVTADGEIVRATATQHHDLFWALRGGGGNFGVVTEFEFRLHPVAGSATEVGMLFDVADAYEPMRAWRDLLADAPRPATLTADAATANGGPAVRIGYTWVGDPDDARRYLDVMRGIGTPRQEVVTDMTYLELQTSGDERHHHGLRRYSADHYLSELSDAAIEAFLSRGIDASADVDWSRAAGGGFQALGGAIAELGNEDTAFSHRHALVEFFAGQTWASADEDAERIASARAFGAAMGPFASGSYVNALTETGDEPLRRAYGAEKLARLAVLKRRYDPENVFHLNQNIPPAP